MPALFHLQQHLQRPLCGRRSRQFKNSAVTVKSQLRRRCDQNCRPRIAGFLQQQVIKKDTSPESPAEIQHKIGTVRASFQYKVQRALLPAVFTMADQRIVSRKPFAASLVFDTKGTVILIMVLRLKEFRADPYRQTV